MKKLQEENQKLRSRLGKWQRKFYKLQKEQDEYWSNKLSLSIIKIGLLLTVGVSLGRAIR